MHWLVHLRVKMCEVQHRPRRQTQVRVSTVEPIATIFPMSSSGDSAAKEEGLVKCSDFQAKKRREIDLGTENVQPPPGLMNEHVSVEEPSNALNAETSRNTEQQRQGPKKECPDLQERAARAEPEEREEDFGNFLFLFFFLFLLRELSHAPLGLTNPSVDLSTLLLPLHPVPLLLLRVRAEARTQPSLPPPHGGTSANHIRHVTCLGLHRKAMRMCDYT